jgi:hypothetical protein
MSESRRLKRKGERYIIKRAVLQIKKEIALGGDREETIAKFYRKALDELKATMTEEELKTDDTNTETDKEV